MSSFPAGSYDHVDFVDDQLGWVAGNGSVVRTRDGGLSWEILTWYDEHGVIWGMDFLDADRGAFVNFPVFSWPQGIWLTQDGGDTWSLARNGSYDEVRFLDAQTLLAVSGHTVDRSDDGGQTWQSFSTFLGEGVSRLEVLDPDTVAAVDWGGSVFLSFDRGESWIQTLDGLGDLPTPWDIRFTDADHGFISGPAGWLLSTDDGGFSWSQMNQGLGGRRLGRPADARRELRPGGGQSRLRRAHRGRRRHLDHAKAGGHRHDLRPRRGPAERLHRGRPDRLRWRFGRRGLPIARRGPDLGVDRLPGPSRRPGSTTWDSRTPTAAGRSARRATSEDSSGGRKTADGAGPSRTSDSAPSTAAGSSTPTRSGSSARGTSPGRRPTAGANWIPYPLPSLWSTPFTDIQFDDQDPDHGWALAYLTIIHTDNGGITWDFQDLPPLQRDVRAAGPPETD